VRNLAIQLKTHFQNGSIYFFHGSFPQKITIFGSNHYRKVRPWIHISFRRLSCGLVYEQTVKNLAKRLKTHFQNGSIYLLFEPFPKKCNILGGITAERYDHGFSSSKLRFSLFFGLSGLLQAT
jgi:hypothetical protein